MDVWREDGLVFLKKPYKELRLRIFTFFGELCVPQDSTRQPLPPARPAVVGTGGSTKSTFWTLRAVEVRFLPESLAPERRRATATAKTRELRAPLIGACRARSTCRVSADNRIR